ncbi:MAG: tryptophan--tRNA ligase [Bacilli bacterium]
MARMISGIKPTGGLTLGNYIGALKRFPTFQSQYQTFLFIADLHALTLPIDPQTLKDNAIDLAAFYLAAGLDPNLSTIFLQSQVSAHAELNAILQNFIYMGELSRMTQFKEKSQQLKDSAIGLGLFAYPVLMASDILLYDAEVVPVGEDQVQHLELTRDLVQRFNHRFGEILVMPKAQLGTTGARVMSLSDPTKKMSKSDPKGNIELKEDLVSIRKKIMSAVTDSDTSIKFDETSKPGISNLISILASLTDQSIENTVLSCQGMTYGAFKTKVADVVTNTIGNLQTRYQSIMTSGMVNEVLNQGAKRAQVVANATLQRVKKAVGLW